jgi:hypothetical protein
LGPFPPEKRLPRRNSRGRVDAGQVTLGALVVSSLKLADGTTQKRKVSRRNSRRWGALSDNVEDSILGLSVPFNDEDGQAAGRQTLRDGLSL